MRLQFTGLVPIPLKDKLLQRPSEVWNTTRVFTKGDRIKINAPSGTGKTTLVHILYKLRHDYEGQVRWDEKNLVTIAEDELAGMRQQKVSIIFQDMRLFENLTARENIELKRLLHQPFYESSIIDEMAGQLGIDHILNQKAGLCSYGEQQRISIIRALVQPFEWLIMDEPFSHLDKDNTLKASTLIAAECNKRNAGFLLTDLDEDEHFTYSHHLRL
jgi:putative ABC transport system ATP-binding protein